MGITSLVRINFDLLSVGIAIAGIILLGSIVFLNNTKSVTSRTFLYFAILTAIWGISNYLSYRFTTIEATLWALRFHIFLSTWHAFLFFQLAYVFPEERFSFPRWYRYGLVPAIGIVSILTLTPLVFERIDMLASLGEVTKATPGFGIIFFLLAAFGCLLSGIFVLLKKTVSSGGSARKQTMVVTIGMILMAFLILIFNVVLPNAYADVSYIPLAALFVLPFIALTSYAIYRHHLFNLKVAATAFLGFMVTVFSFVNILYSESASAIMINVTAFAIILIGSIRIIRDTLSLQEINARQESLLYFVSHEVKAYLTKGAYAFAAIAAEDFGPISPALKTMSSDALAEMQGGLSTVMDILGAANLKKGTVTYNKKPFDLKAAVVKIVEEQKSAAEKKHLLLDVMAGEGPFLVNGDEEKISQHVIRNLIDNAIKYTPGGAIHIDLVRAGNRIRFSVKDNGIGITPEDMALLFTEGGKGKDSSKVNVHSTGYGLSVAKTVVDVHGGSIRAESRGAGTGARFVVEFPITAGAVR